MRFHRTFVRVFVLCGLVACTADDADPATTFDGDCSSAGAACGKISVRWTVDRYGKDATCAAVGGITIKATATFQADGRAATFEASCVAGALLTPSMPVGPYKLDVVLADASDVALSQRSALTTLGVSNTVTETMVELNVIPVIGAGDTFGACGGGAVTCKAATDICQLITAGQGYCAPKCVSESECGRTYREYLEGFEGTVNAWCLQSGPESNAPKACMIWCGRDGDPPCAAGNRCQAIPDSPLKYCLP